MTGKAAPAVAAPLVNRTANKPMRAGGAHPPRRSEAPPGCRSAERQQEALSRICGGAPGWLVSLAVHATLLVLLALLTFSLDRREEVDIFSAPASDDQREVNVVEPTDLKAFDVTTLDTATMETVAFELQAAITEVLAMETTALAVDHSAAAPLESAMTLPEIPTADLLAGVGGVGAGLQSGAGVQGRGKESRRALLAKYGGNAASERAVELGLRWLAAHQYGNGSWRFDHSQCPACNGRCASPGANTSTLGATSIALLAFLGAGHTHREGEHKAVVERGLNHLLSRLNAQGEIANLWRDQGEGLNDANIYCHGFAALALCEAYAMSRDQRLIVPAQAAINYFVDQQLDDGGWKSTASGGGSDLSVSAAPFMALKSGHLSYLRVPPATAQNFMRLLDKTQASEGAQYGYQGPTNPYPGMYKGAIGLPSTSAIGLLARMYTGWEKEHPPLVRGVHYLSETGPSKTDMYYNYYATIVLHHWGGEPWERWNKVMRDGLIARQIQQGHETGSWTPFGAWEPYGGRMMDTCFAVMTLEIYYRYLPIYGNDSVTDDFAL